MIARRIGSTSEYAVITMRIVLRMLVLRDAQQLEAIHLRHADVGDEHRDLFGGEHLQCGLCVADGLDPEVRLQRRSNTTRLARSSST